MGIAVGECIGMWESLQGERGEVWWGAGRGEERCERGMGVRVHQIFIIFQKRYGSAIFLFSSQKNDDM